MLRKAKGALTEESVAKEDAVETAGSLESKDNYRPCRLG